MTNHWCVAVAALAMYVDIARKIPYKLSANRKRIPDLLT